MAKNVVEFPKILEKLSEKDRKTGLPIKVTAKDLGIEPILIDKKDSQIPKRLKEYSKNKRKKRSEK